MKPTLLLPSVALFALGVVVATAADEPKPATGTEGTGSPILAETAGSPAPPRAAGPGISAATVARIAALTPKFSPSPSTATEAPNPVLKETDDKPKNGIIRLPAYLVVGPKTPTLNEVQVLTPKGRVDLAYKAFPGLRFGSFWIFRNDGIADAMLDEELMLARQREVADLMSLLPANRPESNSPRDRLIRDALAPRSNPAAMDSSGDR